MRRIGTISSAIGFIFLGVWMIIDRSNPVLGDAIIKWWPAIIIILGVEVLISFTREKTDTKKVGFNGLIIFVIIIFICVNAFNGVFDFFSKNKNIFSVDKLIKIGTNIDSGNNKEISTTKTIKAFGTNFKFETHNAVIGIYKSEDKNIKIDAKVYVAKNSTLDKYNIAAEKEANGYSVIMEDDYIKGVRADIYIPDGYKVILKTDSSSIKGNDKFTSSSYEIESGSGTIDLDGGESLALNVDSGTMKIKDIKNIKVDGGSGTINISGNTQTVVANLGSGIFNLDNDICKNVELEMGSGMVNIKTKDKNANIDAELDSGICSVNSEKRINAGISKTIGSGIDKIKVDLGSGTIKISSQE
jgi:hypothetical protein